METQAGPTGADVYYFSKLAAGSFEIPRCQACSRHHFFPRVCCPYCGSQAPSWIAPTGRAIVYATTVVRKAEGDYTVCLVDLEEGPRMMSTVVGIPVDEVQIGMPVQARVEQTTNGPLLVFVPRGGGHLERKTTGCGGHSGNRSGGPGPHRGLTEQEIIAQAAGQAVTRSGLAMKDIDGIVTSSLTSPWWVMRMAEYLGIRPRFSDSTMFGESSFIADLKIASLAIEAGECENVLICYGTTPRSATSSSKINQMRAELDPQPYEHPYKPFNRIRPANPS